MESLKADYCVVGGGFSGIAAAYKLTKMGKSVYVLEARNRLGGRVYSETLPDGSVINWGGTFIGEGHHRVYALAKELGCEIYPFYDKGEKIMFLNGKVLRYSKAIPGINPLALVDLGLAIYRLNSMAAHVPLDAPWKAKKASKWDSQTLGSWMDHPCNVFTNTAKKILKSVWTEVFMSHPNEVSLLHALFMIHSLTSIEWIVSEKGGAQQDLMVGGMQRLAEKMAEKMGDIIRFNAPVRSIKQNEKNVQVIGDSIVLEAKRVIVAIPPILAAQMHYDPPLPALKSQLLDRSPAGQAIRCYAVYEKPFWRELNLNGIGADLDNVPQATIDTSPKEGKPGILTAYIWGPPARDAASLSKEERRKVFLNGLVKRFGEKAATPMHFVELDWAAEEWTRGDMFAHYGPGVLTGFGSALRLPCGRIHWAGTETATHWAGSMEGAIRAGERAADEILSHQD